MSNYRESETDRKNALWFANNKSCNTLLKIAITQSSIRGLGKCEVEFKYPITVIVGENGSGKSTLLSLVSCAFHNETPFCPMSLLSNTKKQRRHYTYSDFFAFTPAERGIMKDVEIVSTFLSDKNRNTDIRSKSPKGQWKDYDSRPKRAVSFLGINRLLPPYESKTYRNYRSNFGSSKLTDEQKTALTDYMRQIFGKDYTGVLMWKYNKYRLYGCTKGAGTYTGFNMGAGENAVVQLLYEILTAGSGALIVVDEIELGLHVQAQKKLIKILKELCLKNNCQIICSSHSAAIVGSIPPAGRVMIKPNAASIDIVYGISEELAMSELSGENLFELYIFVEDDVAKDFIEFSLPHSVRRRVDVQILGSADGSMLYAIDTHLRERRTNFITVMDGDKRSAKSDKIKKVADSLADNKVMAREEVQAFLEERLLFLPGNEWPEKTIIEALLRSQDLSKFMDECKVDDIEELKRYLQRASSSEKHSEFYDLANMLHLEENAVRQAAIRQYGALHLGEVQYIIDNITKVLN